MIKRIVRMEIHPNELEKFKNTFAEVRQQILNVSGCNHLELWIDKRATCAVATYSEWDSLEDLEAYRHSELFLGIWPRLKAMFNSKAKAWSFEEIKDV